LNGDSGKSFAQILLLIAQKKSIFAAQITKL